MCRISNISYIFALKIKMQLDMKKLFMLLAMMLTITAEAQDKLPTTPGDVSHMKFMGIPMDCDAETFSKRLEQEKGLVRGNFIDMAQTEEAPDTTCVDLSTMTGKNDKLPQFRHGMSDLVRYLLFNLKYPKEAKKAGVEGRVLTVFIVEADGSVSHVQPVQSIVHFKNKKKLLETSGMSEQELTDHYGNLFQDEAKRVISTMPNWTPGQQSGKPIRVKYSLPVTFAAP